MFISQKNEISGLVSILTGGKYHCFVGWESIYFVVEPTLFSYRTHGITDICTITKENFYELMRIQPNLVLSIAASMFITFYSLRLYCFWSFLISDGSTNVSISTANRFFSRMDVGWSWKSSISVQKTLSSIFLTISFIDKTINHKTFILF